MAHPPNPVTRHPNVPFAFRSSLELDDFLFPGMLLPARDWKLPSNRVRDGDDAPRPILDRLIGGEKEASNRAFREGSGKWRSGRTGRGVSVHGEIPSAPLCHDWDRRWSETDEASRDRSAIRAPVEPSTQIAGSAPRSIVAVNESKLRLRGWFCELGQSEPRSIVWNVRSYWFDARTSRLFLEVTGTFCPVPKPFAVGRKFHCFPGGCWQGWQLAVHGWVAIYSERFTSFLEHGPILRRNWFLAYHGIICHSTPPGRKVQCGRTFPQGHWHGVREFF
jgi:hypothetical protein